MVRGGLYVKVPGNPLSKVISNYIRSVEDGGFVHSKISAYCF